MENDINRIMNGYDEAIDAAEYEEALILDDELIEGSDYRMIWSDTYSGSYPPNN